MTELDTEIRPTPATETLTEYVVLSLNDANQAWHEEDVFSGRSNEDAIRRCLTDAENPEGTFVAVPKRSWKPVTVKAEQTISLKLEQAT